MGHATIVLTGPTASGKTTIAETLATECSGEIVSADSRTVYSEIMIGNGRYTMSKDIVYHLVGTRKLGEPYSVHDFLMEARASVEDIHRRGGTPIVCGGTCHFIERFLRGLDPGPPPDWDLRQHYRRLTFKHGPELLHSILEEKDPLKAAKIHVNDLKRTIRALEDLAPVEKRPPIPPFQDEVKAFFLDLPPRESRERIERRTAEMFELGWIEEAKRLLEMGFDERTAGLDMIGFHEVFEHLRGNLPLREAQERIMARTTRYAKAQRKWASRLGLNMIDASVNASRPPIETVREISDIGRGR